MKLFHTYIFILGLLLCMTAEAQEYDYAGDPDKSFFVARDLAFSGETAQARDTLQLILSRYPEYVDVRNLLAKTYSWDKKYDEARKHFNKITSKNKDNKEVWLAAVKNEIYAQNYHTALGLANKSLKHLSNDSDLLALKEEAISNITKQTSQDSFEVKKEPKNSVAISNSFEVYDIVFDPMYYASLEYKRETKYGSIIPRVNYSNRFNINGTQYEIDAYPKFSEKFYGYLNYGYSKAKTYPSHKMAAEVYTNFSKAFEASLGYKFMDFTSIKANIFTGSFGLYKGNYYASLRPYVTLSSQNQFGGSGNVLVRKYLKHEENYLGVSLGIGYSPELQQLIDGDTVLAETQLFIESQRLRIEYQFSNKSKTNLYQTNLGFTRQELAFSPGKFMWSVSAGIIYHVKF